MALFGLNQSTSLTVCQKCWPFSAWCKMSQICPFSTIALLAILLLIFSLKNQLRKVHKNFLLDFCLPHALTWPWSWILTGWSNYLSWCFLELNSRQYPGSKHKIQWEREGSLTSAYLLTCRFLHLQERYGSPIHRWSETNASLSDLEVSSGSLLYIYVACSPSAGNNFMEHLTSLFSVELQLCVLMLWC